MWKIGAFLHRLINRAVITAHNTATHMQLIGYNMLGLGRVAQSVTCLATDACLTADPGVASSIPAQYHTFVEIDHEIISTVILLPSTDLFKKVDLVYKLKKIVGSNNFSAQFINIISHYKKIGYNINVLQQTACLVVNPITVGNFSFLFNCTPVGRTSDSMMVPT